MDKGKPTIYYIKRSVIPVTLLILVAIVYFYVDPESVKWMPQCIFYRFTGFECPGCGSQRMLHALLQGDFVSAWGYNPFAFLMIPVLLFFALLEIFRKRWNTLYAKVFHPLTAWIFFLVIIGWWIVRNLW